MQVHHLDALGAERLGAVPLRVDRREGGEAALLPLPVVADGLGRPDGHRRVTVLEAEHARLLPHRPRPPLAVAERDVRRHARADDAHHRHRRRLPHVRPQRGGVRLPHPARLRADVRLDLAQQRAHVCCRAEVVLPRRRVACAEGEDGVVAKDALARQEHVRSRHLSRKVPCLEVRDDEARDHLGAREEDPRHLRRPSERRRDGDERLDLCERLCAEDAVEAVDELEVAEGVGGEQRLAVARVVGHVVQHRRQVGAQLVLRRREPPVVRHAKQVAAGAVACLLQRDNHVPKHLGRRYALSARLEDARDALDAPVGAVRLHHRPAAAASRVERLDPRAVEAAEHARPRGERRAREQPVRLWQPEV
mmetsp:Transcript_39951/g.132146  ORF Transcript_39951/g.132146 Transcript_39951/m.132146 type:complete len:364 (-) Transcript_39951:229-1320(-)